MDRIIHGFLILQLATAIFGRCAQNPYRCYPAGPSTCFVPRKNWYRPYVLCYLNFCLSLSPVKVLGNFNAFTPLPSAAQMVPPARNAAPPGVFY